MTAIEKLSNILRTDRDYLAKIDARLSTVTGKKGVLERIVDENSAAVERCLLTLGVANPPAGGAGAREVYDALISKIEADDHIIFKAFGEPKCSDCNDCERMLAVAKKVAGIRKGFFMKEEKAREFLAKKPPREVMGYLGYDLVETMLAKEDLYEVMSALRFIEGSEWLNNVFFKQYETLTPDDFEEREVKAQALSDKWVGAAEKFVRKKWHNISHLKELGVVFVIPIHLGISGEILRMLSLVFHYLHEVPFYSDMFRRVAEVPTTFAANVISLLRGDVFDRHLSEGDKTFWLVVQRYLAKDDEHDWRLSVPRVNPEALHWMRAEEDLVKLGDEVDGFAADMAFWKDLGWVGDYFKDEIGNNTLVSFNIVDTVMSLVKQKELVKYLYHHQEALWNKIFMEYFSCDELEKVSKEYLLQGYFEI
ncbi:MAG: hypothetical protein HYU81_02605 [Candidatus Brennerbacteria bacterium]|nr:hypothetical protein [Candidatus Brennerbacteria bacterium]